MAISCLLSRQSFGYAPRNALKGRGVKPLEPDPAIHRQNLARNKLRRGGEK